MEKKFQNNQTNGANNGAQTNNININGGETRNTAYRDAALAALKQHADDVIRDYYPSLDGIPSMRTIMKKCNNLNCDDSITIGCVHVRVDGYLTVHCNLVAEYTRDENGLYSRRLSWVCYAHKKRVYVNDRFFIDGRNHNAVISREECLKSALFKLVRDAVRDCYVDYAATCLMYIIDDMLTECGITVNCDGGDDNGGDNGDDGGNGGGVDAYGAACEASADAADTADHCYGENLSGGDSGACDSAGKNIYDGAGTTPLGLSTLGFDGDDYHDTIPFLSADGGVINLKANTNGWVEGKTYQSNLGEVYVYTGRTTNGFMLFRDNGGNGLYAGRELGNGKAVIHWADCDEIICR